MRSLKQYTSHFALACACAFALSACSEDALDAPAREITIAADNSQFEQSATSRTSVTVDDDDIAKVYWLPQEQIGVFAENGSTTDNACFTSSNTTTVARASFKGTIAGDAKYAYYPYRSDAASLKAVPVTVPSEQVMPTSTDISSIDVKAGELYEAVGSDLRFNFYSMVALVRFEINVEGFDAVDGSKELLRSLTIEPADENAQYEPLTGDFTMDLTNRAQGLAAVTGNNSLKVTAPHDVGMGGTVCLYAAMAPNNNAEKPYKITFVTDYHTVSVVTTMEQELKQGYFYHIPLTMSKAQAEPEYSLTVEDTPENKTVLAPRTLRAFSFRYADNTGKLLTKEVVTTANNDVYTQTVRDITDEQITLAITEDGDQGSMRHFIPYLYDCNLVPTFSIPEGCRLFANGVELKSGVTSVDFTKPVTLLVTDDKGGSRQYTVDLYNTGLPVVVLNSNGHGSVSWLHTSLEPKNADWPTDQTFALYDKKEPSNNVAEMNCGFRLRGNSSQQMPKKPLAIKLDKKTKLMGMKKHKRWVLLAGWTDRTMMRNIISFHIANLFTNTFTETGKTSIPWNPTGQNVELVLDGVHVGNYVLCEQIKIDENRLNIRDPYEDVLADYTKNPANPEPTFDNCGFLMEFDDNFDETYTYMTTKKKLPMMAKDDVLDDGLWTELKNYVQNVENLLDQKKYADSQQFLDWYSVADYQLIYELTMNNEYHHPKSVYMYKDGAGKLSAGPVWDFDYRTFPNFLKISNRQDEFQGCGYTKFMCYQYSYSESNSINTRDYPYMWYPLLMNSNDYKTLLKARWNAIYAQLQSVSAKIREVGESLKLSADVNFAMWPMSGADQMNNLGWQADAGDFWCTTYEQAIQNMIDCYEARLNGLNATIQGF